MSIKRLSLLAGLALLAGCEQVAEPGRAANAAGFPRAGRAVDPRLPAASFDRVLLMHVYHEVAEPYAFLWYLRGGLRRGGRVVVVDADQDGHGIAPARLFCEFAAVGYRLTEFVRKPEIKGYYASFEAAGARPEPGAIKACR